MTALQPDPTLQRRDWLAAERVRRTAELANRDHPALTATRRRQLADDERRRSVRERRG